MFWQRVLTALPSVQGHVKPKCYGEADDIAVGVSTRILTPYSEADGIAVGVSTRILTPYSEADGFTVGVTLTCTVPVLARVPLGRLSKSCTDGYFLPSAP